MNRSTSTGLAHLPITPRLVSDRIPFTFTQRWWYDWWDRVPKNGTDHDVRHMRPAADAIRIFGRLNIRALRRSLGDLYRRHEALRTRVVSFDGIGTQVVDEAAELPFDLIDLSALPRDSVESRARALVDELVYEPCGVTFFATRLLKITDLDHIFIVAMHHLISDGASVEILQRDLWTLYSQCVRGLTLSLPRLSVQYADYAIWQYRTEQSWAAKNRSYWDERFIDSPQIDFPIDEQTGNSLRLEMTREIKFGKSMTSGLRALARRERSTAPLIVLAICAAIMLRWLNVSDLVVGFVVSGRNIPELENIVGFVASLLYLRIQLNDDDNFLDLLRNVTKEYCTAYDHYDHGRMSVAASQSGIKRCISLNWFGRPDCSDVVKSVLAEYLDGSDEVLGVEEFPITPLRFLELRAAADSVDTEPSLLLSETNGEIKANVGYRSDLISSTTIERFIRNVGLLSKRVLEQPGIRVVNIPFD
jgi:hypothetical protein